MLTEPGLSDITAHVNFTEMKRAAAAEGLQLISESSLAAWVLRVFGQEGLEERWRSAGDEWRLQWKQLVFGLGETFRVLEFEKGFDTKKKAPDLIGGLR